MACATYDSTNLWDEWFPEDHFAAVLAGEHVEANIGQVRGAWKQALEREVRAGRLVKWRGRWFPVPGAPFGIGPLKDCYGTAAIRDLLATAPRNAAGRSTTNRRS